jgi:Predicted transcriptional regulators
MTEFELAELVRDIAKHGLREPIVLDSTGEFLVDGRNRKRACERANIEPRYRRLDPDVDIFAYVVSVNLHRRHLTADEQKALIREIKEHNPDMSNREIAKIANVGRTTVNEALSCSTDQDRPVEQKTKGADGKLRPARGRISDAKREAIINDLKRNVLTTRDIAARHNISVGTVAGIKHRATAPGQSSRSPTIKEQLERRKQNLKPYDSMTREERGMGTREYGAEQHPDYPPGWTRDAVHRENYGRIQIDTPAKIAQRKMAMRFTELIGTLASLLRGSPLPCELDGLSAESAEMIHLQLRKLAPQIIELMSEFLRTLGRADDWQTQPTEIEARPDQLDS